ncbi:condensation domain-containing protein [Spirosoma areae]
MENNEIASTGLSSERKRLLDKLLKKEVSSENNELVQRVVNRRNGPLTWAQSSIFIMTQCQDINPALLNLSYAISIKGPFDQKSFSLTVKELIFRHEVLRTIYTSCEDNLAAYALLPNEYQLPIINKRYSKYSRKIIFSFAKKIFETPFDITKDLPIRIGIIHLTIQKEFIIFFSFHHICADAWSLELFCKEFSQIYKNFIEHNSITLPYPKIQCMDYALMQRNWLSTSQGKELQKLWLNRIRLIINKEQRLPYDKPRYPVPYLRTSRQVVHLCEIHMNYVKELAKLIGASVFMILLSCFVICLEKWTGIPQQNIATLSANRQGQGTKIMGALYNTVLIDTALEPNITVLQKINIIIHRCIEAFYNEKIPFSKAQQLLNILSLGKQAFSVMFLTDKYPLYYFKVEKCETVGIDIESIKNQFQLEINQNRKLDLPLVLDPILTLDSTDLTFFVREGQDGDHTLSVFYKTDLFHDQTISDLIMNYHSLISNLKNENV